MQQPTVRVIKANQVRNLVSDEKKIIRVAAYCRVSTDGDEQLNSFASQKAYYKEKIESNPEWVLVDLYADEAITGTKVDIREGFRKMMDDAFAGRIDIIMTKSISRFARNTVDTLNYVRKLKEKRVAVFFEEENINTLTMDGELLLTILSSVAQQEVQNVSEHVKAGLKMKLQRGEMVGFNGCYGYDYHPENKSITVNPEEAKIVKFMFERYAQGYGASSIAKELYAMGIKPKRGNDRWKETTITGIIRNEKYYGDAIFGKTYTTDPISKKRVDNKGQVDVYQFENHHEPIVSKELWDKANAYLEQRASKRRGEACHTVLDFNGKYCMSFKVKCGFCGSGYHRRSHQQTTTEFKSVWKCGTQTKLGRTYCADSRTFDENALQAGFVSALKTLVNIEGDVFDSIIKTANEVVGNSDPKKRVLDAEKSISALRDRQKKLVDLMLDGTITKDDYQVKSSDLAQRILEREKEIKEIEDASLNQRRVRDKLMDIKEKICSTDTILVFDSEVFSETIDRVIIGGVDETGKRNPQLVTYVFDMATDDYKKSSIQDYVVIADDYIDYEFWTYDIQDNGARKRKHLDGFPIRIALKTK